MERVDRVLGYEKSHKIIQESDGFNFSIDSTMLSFFMMPKLRTSRILDIGTGNGIIPLLYSMMTTKKIIGVEIDEKASDRARRSVMLNGLENQIKIINDDIKNLRNTVPPQTFSLVTSNPPYFRLQDTKDKNEDESVKAARHETKITFAEIVKEAQYHLTDKGSFAFVQRCERFSECLNECIKNRLFPKRVRFAYPKPKKESHIFMMECVKNGSDHGMIIEEPIYIFKDDGNYSDEIISYFHFKENEEK